MEGSGATVRPCDVGFQQLPRALRREKAQAEFETRRWYLSGVCRFGSRDGLGSEDNSWYHGGERRISVFILAAAKRVAICFDVCEEIKSRY
jgi:hypothetical protein